MNTFSTISRLLMLSAVLCISNVNAAQGNGNKVDPGYVQLASDFVTARVGEVKTKVNLFRNAAQLDKRGALLQAGMVNLVVEPVLSKVTDSHLVRSAGTAAVATGLQKDAALNSETGKILVANFVVREVMRRTVEVVSGVKNSVVQSVDAAAKNRGWDFGAMKNSACDTCLSKENQEYVTAAKNTAYEYGSKGVNFLGELAVDVSAAYIGKNIKFN